MRITVKTGTEDKPAPDITDSLLSSTESMLARGKTELFGAADAYRHGVSMPLQSMINTGEIGEIHDYKYGESYRGKVEGVSIDIAPAGINITIDVERPA